MKVRKALFQHSEPLRFTQGRWVTSNVVSKRYVAYKLLAALFLMTNQILSLANADAQHHLNKYWIYATHWGFVLITLALLWDAILVFARFSFQNKLTYLRKQNPYFEKCHLGLKLSILLTSTAYPMALFVTLAFWSFLFDFSQEFHFNLGSYINLAVHLFQALLAIVDTLISSRPWRLWHMWCPMVLGLIYMLFNVIYIMAFDGTSISGEDFVYSIIDWKNNPGWATAFVFMSLVAFPVLFSVFYFVAKLRDLLWRKWLDIEDDSLAVASSSNPNAGIYSVSIKLQDSKNSQEINVDKI